jgi:hypothetical protein
MSSPESLEQLLDAVADGSLARAAFAGDRVTFASGAEFSRDSLLAVEGLKPLRLDVALFFAQHALRLGWALDRVLYVKARLRAASPPRLR